MFHFIKTLGPLQKIQATSLSSEGQSCRPFIGLVDGSHCG